MASRFYPPFLAGLRGGIPRERLRHPVEPLTIPIYAVLATAVAGLAIAFAVSDFAYEDPGLNRLNGALLILIGCSMLLRRYGHPRIGGPLEAFAILALTGLVTVCATVMLSATALPYAHAGLARADALIGFDWLALTRRLQGQDTFLLWANRAYYSLNWQPFVLFVALFALGHEARIWTMLTAWAIGLVVTGAIFPLLPAMGGFLYHGIPAADLPPGAPVKFMQVLEGVREGTLRRLDGPSIQGLVTFPSFHASAAVLLAWAFGAVRPLGWIFVPLNIAMAAAAIVIGGHYLVDIIAGVAVAGGAIWAAGKLAAILRPSNAENALSQGE